MTIVTHCCLVPTSRQCHSLATTRQSRPPWPMSSGCQMAADRPSNRLVYLWDGPAQTIVRSATLRWKVHINCSSNMLVYLRDGSAQTIVRCSSNMLVYLRDGSAQTMVRCSSNMLVYLRDGSAQTIVRCSRNMLVYLRDGSAQTIVRAATITQKLQIKCSTSSTHSILTPGRPVPALTL